MRDRLIVLGLLLGISLIAGSLLIFSPSVSADLGRKPTLEIEIIQNGSRVSGKALVCYNGWSSMGMGGTEDIRGRDSQYIQGLLNSEFNVCEYANNGLWDEFFYELPSKIAILYPCYGDLYDVDEQGSATEDNQPVLYRSDTFSSARQAYDFKYQAHLDPDGSIILDDNTPVVTTYGLVTFILALIITVILELLVAIIYLNVKRLPRKISRTVILVNLISLPIVWFIILQFIRQAIIGLVIAEIFVVFFEALFLHVLNRKVLDFKNSLIMSLILNLVSLFIGGIVYFVISFLFLGLIVALVEHLF